ncbi:iron-containing redox enzyme family protein [Streptomyces sp. NPDC006670]|uniref:iron-containing redox enzyme family protein n=1 Tax=Streptomyces sp. NPDC006670 TaxID=3154476 RepID=UPI0033EE6D45
MSAPLTPDEGTSLDMARSSYAPAFTLPDLTTSLPSGPFEASPQGAAEAARITAGPPADLFRRLIADQESEAVLLAARRVLAAFLTPGDEDTAPGPDVDADADADAVAAHVLAARAELAAVLGPLRTHPDPQVRTAVLRQRAPLALTGGCWLDTLSQAATQPAEIVGRLFGQHWLLQGEGTSEAGLSGRRRRALTVHGVHLPGVESAAFLDAAGALPLTALHGAFHLALSRLPASFLPEVVGVHYAAHALGLDELLLGTEPMLAEADVRPVLAAYLAFTEDSPTGPADRRRALAAVRLLLRLEREHTAALAELAAWHDGLSLDAKVARIVERHAPYAGRQHGAVRLGTRPLTDWLDTGDLDAAGFVRELRGSRRLKPARDGGPCRFLKAVKFGGPMFGIFDEAEAAVLTAWARAVADGEPAGADLTPLTAGDAAARAWSGRLAAADPADILVGEPEGPEDHRRFFHRLVNFERHPSVLPLARARAEAGLAEAEVLFEHGAEGLLTDASWFPYTPEALLERVERIYRDKLVDPYEPLTEIPSRDEVVFEQSTYALGSLIDGTWAHRVGNLGRRGRRSDDMLFAIYADEMGRGDSAKNHITLIHKVLASMDMDLPHIRQEAFLHQGELPDHLYGFSVHQLCLSLFPDSLYDEILGYNLGIEMFGLGAMRMHAIQKLRRHGLDASYEEAHLSIDNFSAGHARQSADIVVAHLDEVRHLSGEEAVQRAWRRIWRGYASFAFFIEHALVKRVRAAAAEDAAAPAELVI